MLNPIKRIWVPKPRATPAAELPASAPAAAAPDSNPNIETPQRRGVLYAEIPEPDVEERATESVWAAFNSVLPTDELTKSR
jgi:hypothetical protein